MCHDDYLHPTYEPADIFQSTEKLFGTFMTRISETCQTRQHMLEKP